jgi:hypothetical protein
MTAMLGAAQDVQKPHADDDAIVGSGIKMDALA